MRRKAVSTIMLILLSLSIVTFTLIQTVRASPTIITVPDDYPTIQEAIDAANPGDTVLVRDGTYYEHLFIDKMIKLLGESEQNTVIDGNSFGTLVWVNSDNVTISGFNLTNAGSSWPIPWNLNKPDCAVWVSGFRSTNVSGNIITRAAVGIFCGYADEAIASNNYVSEMKMSGIIFYDSSECRAYNNRVTSCKYMGIHLDQYSRNCLVANNSIVDNPEAEGIELAGGSYENLVQENLLADNHGGVFFFSLGSNNIFRSNNMTGNRYNFGTWGLDMHNFVQDIDTSNIVGSQPIFYMVNKHHVLITSTNETIPGYLALINSSDITVEGLSFSNNLNGILLAQTTNCTIENLKLSGNHEGMLLFDSNRSTILNNRFDNNSVAAIVYSSNQDTFYHNSFLNNTYQILSQYLSGTSQPAGPSGLSTNQWDNGLQGNYWSDYNGTDSNRDGIGDSPYTIDANNQDRYPLMNPWREETGLSPFWIQWWFWLILVAAGITLLVRRVYFLRKEKKSPK